MMMTYSLTAVLFLAAVFVCSEGNVSEREANLTQEPFIMQNGRTKLTCGPFEVGLSSTDEVEALQLQRMPSTPRHGPGKREMIALYKPYLSPDAEPILGNMYMDGRWTIKKYGREPTGPADSFYMTVEVDKAECSDAGDYYCVVSYRDQGEDKQMTGHMYLPAIDELHPMQVTGIKIYNDLTEDVYIGDTVRLDCSIRGPAELKMTWLSDGEVIDNSNSPPEVLKVENSEPIFDEKYQDCTSYRHQQRLIFKVTSSSFRYQCKWTYKTRNESAFFDIGSSGWTWKGVHTPKGRSFTCLFVIALLVGVAGLALAGVGVYLIVSTRKRRSFAHGPGVQPADNIHKTQIVPGDLPMKEKF